MPNDDVPTRSAARATLAAAGVTGAAAEAVLDATAADRHAARVRRFVEAALADYTRCTGKPAGTVGASAYAIGVLVLEAFGVVDAKLGPRPHRKLHHRAFRDQCGPRAGPAAGATFAACHDAVGFLWRQGVHLHHGLPEAIVVRPCLDPVAGAGLEIEAAPLRPCRLYVEPSEAIESQPPGWLTSIALEALRRGVGATPWYELAGERRASPEEHDPSPHVLDLIHLEGDLALWGHLIEATAERVRIEAVAARLGSLSRWIGLLSQPPPDPLFKLVPYSGPARATVDQIVYWFREALPSCSAAMAERLLLVERSPVEHVVEHVRDALCAANRWIAAARTCALEELAAAPTFRSEVDPGRLAAAMALLMLARVYCKIDGDLPWTSVRLARTDRAIGTIVEREEVPVVLVCDPEIGVLLGIDGATIAEVTAASGNRAGFAELALAAAEHLEQGERTLAGAEISGTATEWRAAAAKLGAS